MESLYFEIMEMWEKAKVSMEEKRDPLHPTPVFDDTDPFEDLYKEINDILAKRNDFSNTDFQQMMNPFLVKLKQSMGIEFTLDGFIQYVMAPPTECCSHFMDNPLKDEIVAEFDKQGETPKIPLILFLQCLSCGTCNNLRNKHKVCFFYTETNGVQGETCGVCGFYKYEHLSCGAFEKNNNDPKKCTICCKDRREHIEMLHLKCCGKDFVNDGSNFCSLCLHSISDHLYQPPFFYLETIEQMTLNLKINLFMGNIVKNTAQPSSLELYSKMMSEVYIPEFRMIATKRL